MDIKREVYEIKENLNNIEQVIAAAALLLSGKAADKEHENQLITFLTDRAKDRTRI